MPLNKETKLNITNIKIKMKKKQQKNIILIQGFFSLWVC